MASAHLCRDGASHLDGPALPLPPWILPVSLCPQQGQLASWPEPPGELCGTGAARQSSQERVRSLAPSLSCVSGRLSISAWLCCFGSVCSRLSAPCSVCLYLELPVCLSGSSLAVFLSRGRVPGPCVPASPSVGMCPCPPSTGTSLPVVNPRKPGSESAGTPGGLPHPSQTLPAGYSRAFLEEG